MGKGIINGAIGAIFILMLIVVVIIFWAPIDVAPIYLLNPEKALCVQDSIAIDSIKCLHMEVLKDLENKGVLLTPNEYTSHISDYYNTLVTTVLGLFVLFSIGSFYSLKSAYRKEFDEMNTTIENHKKSVSDELKKNIIDSLQELMRDSISFKETCIEALYGRLEDTVISHEEKEKIEEQITILKEDIRLLYDSYDELLENKTSNEELE